MTSSSVSCSGGGSSCNDCRHIHRFCRFLFYGCNHINRISHLNFITFKQIVVCHPYILGIIKEVRDVCVSDASLKVDGFSDLFSPQNEWWNGRIATTGLNVGKRAELATNRLSGSVAMGILIPMQFSHHLPLLVANGQDSLNALQ